MRVVMDTRNQSNLLPESEITPAFLATAFARFEEASSRLEERYASLKTESERLRVELQKKEEEVRRAEKMAVLGQTAAALAHEIRNPLGAIKLFMSLLREDVANMPSSLGLVEEVNCSISTLDRVISNVLQFAKDKECALAPANLNNIIAEEINLFKKMDRQNSLSIETRLSEHTYILGNDGLLRQMLSNLLTNSAQASHYKGTISISSELENDSLKLIISDNGPGIAADILPKLFEPFVTGRAEGTGLGLAVVKNIVTRHGASISAANDGGAKFTILFPVSRRGL